jgi:hypothetical protein
MRLIGPLMVVGHGVAPAGIGRTPKRPWLGLAVAAGVPDARAAGPAEPDEVITEWDVVDAELPAEHPTSKAATPRKTI